MGLVALAVVGSLEVVGACGTILVALVGAVVEMISMVDMGPGVVDMVDEVGLEVGVAMTMAHMTDTSKVRDESGMMLAGDLERGAEIGVIVEVRREFGHGVMIEAEVGAGAEVGVGQGAASARAEVKAGAGAEAEVGASIGMRGLGDRRMTTLQCQRP